jgi:hypothetical protein
MERTRIGGSFRMGLKKRTVAGCGKGVGSRIERISKAKVSPTKRRMAALGGEGEPRLPIYHRTPKRMMSMKIGLGSFEQ